jgi:hypothetical protein
LTTRIIITAALFLQVISLKAQDPIDALRYSMIGHGGTARARAIGGAVVSLGGDISSATVNPAGLGMFKTNEFVFSPALGFGSTKINYLNSENKDKKFNADFSNIGLILAKSGSQDGKWRNFTFGFGMNKTVNFSNNTLLKGNNNQSSYSEKYLEELINNNVTDPNFAASNYPYGASLAFNTYLIDTISGPGNAVSGYRSLATPQTGVLQQQNIATKGGIQDIYFAGSANLLDKLYLGGGLVFSKLSYERTTTFRESDATQNKLNRFNYFEVEEFLKTEGVGVGLKIGAIFKPVEQLRIGFALHTPLIYNMDDRYTTKITTDLEGYQGSGVLTQTSLDFNSGEKGQFQYNYINPMRIMLGLSYVLHEVEDVTKQKGFISADVEFLDYSTSKFKTYSGSTTTNLINGENYLKEVTAAVKNQFKSAMNVRLGGELKFNTIMTRLGFNYMGNPYATSIKARQMNISGGLGYRDKGFFIDLTYVHQLIKDAAFPYKLDNGFYEPGYVKGSNGNLIATVGVKF